MGGFTTDASGAAVRTSDITVHNADEALDAPLLLSASSSSLDLGWSVPSVYAPRVDAGCASQVLRDFELEQSSDHVTFSLVYRGIATSFVVSGLQPATSYSFRVRGGSSLGYAASRFEAA